eukprot:TRINITY_DN1314_c2_g3_i1.p1 TRINITY_DN1314_c2_g3~~TRINITY_DN1314_c2_g3_i1.p1  ORF type:complete len:724 (+),score=133.99 TRINITY_DN1314_c2_g3_i1:62-2173(+)
MQDLGEPIPMPPAPPPAAAVGDDAEGESKPLPRIIASNLPKSWGNINLGKFFEQFGAVTDCGLMPGTDKGYVLLSNVADILKAVRSVPQLPPVDGCKILAVVDESDGGSPEPVSDVKRMRLDDTTPLGAPPMNDNINNDDGNDDRTRKQKLPMSTAGDLGGRRVFTDAPGQIIPLQGKGGNGLSMHDKHRDNQSMGHHHHGHHHHHNHHHHHGHHHHHPHHHRHHHLNRGRGGGNQPALARFLNTPVGPTGVPASGPINTNNPSSMDTLKKSLLSNPALRNALQQMTGNQAGLLPAQAAAPKPVVPAGVQGLGQPAPVLAGNGGVDLLSTLQNVVASRTQPPQNPQPFPTAAPTPQLQPPQGGMVQQLLQTLAAVQGKPQTSLTPQGPPPSVPNRGIPPSMTSPPNQSSSQLLDLVKNLKNNNKQLPPAAVPGSLPPSQHPSAAPPAAPLPNTSNLAALLTPGLLQNSSLLKQVTAALPAASSKPPALQPPVMPTQTSTPSKGLSKQKSEILSKRPEGSDAVYIMMKSTCHEFLAQSVEHELWNTTDIMAETLNTHLRNNKSVILIFSVRGSGYFTGYAEMLGPVRHRSKHLTIRDIVDQLPPSWTQIFRINWRRVGTVEFSDTAHLRIDGRPIQSVRDGDVILPEQGAILCSMIDDAANPSTTKSDPSPVKKSTPRKDGILEEKMDFSKLTYEEYVNLMKGA